jgi:arylsulfatase A-like enzyme
MMKRRDFLKAISISAAALGTAGSLGAAAPAAQTAAGAKRPNVLFIFSDMQRAYSMGCYGDANARTPRLDRFAAQGARFDAAISTTPVCCPFRTCLMSGQYAHHHGTMSNGTTFNPTVKCLGETFRDAGHETGYIGKWHIPAADKNNRYGFPAAGEKYGNYETRHDVKPLADLMVEFLEEHRQSDKPWLCMLSWLPPHSPYQASPGYAEHFKNITLPPNVPEGAPQAHAQRALPDYYGMIEEIDQEFGRIMDTLEKTGAAENTIVVYTSDHGDMVGCQGLSAKRWPYEESARIPLLIRYPRAIKPGQVIKDPIGAPDFYPTLAALAGVQAPA